ncbi:MAG: ABC transporter permease subunit [Gammaproteobacteria bacterium]|nr:ABC transporter permease subunit [Gammaproteobacteria bacterium]
MTDLVVFLQLYAIPLWTHLLQHIYLSGIAIIIAACIGIPIGILIAHIRTLRNFALNIVSIFQTIPSLALLALLIPLVGIGFKPTIITLTIYALLPLVRSTFTGLQNVPNNMLEASDGLGFTRWQRLWLVELPLAMPVIISGVRIAAAMAIGITTIAAFVGAGGLGDFITQGLALNNTKLILLGAIPTALLALSVDFLIAQLEKFSSIRQRKKRSYSKLIVLLIIPIVVLSFLMVNTWRHLISEDKNTIVISSKNFTEQYILANMMVDLIRAKTHLRVVKKLGLGTTAVMQQALLHKKIDLYPEYTGTAYLVVLKRKDFHLPAKQLYQRIKHSYQRQFALTWLQPFGFNNSQTLAVSQATAKKYHLKTLSDLAKVAKQLTLAAPAAFIKRADALPGLRKAYQLKFSKIYQMEPDLLYQAIKTQSVDVIEVFTTDGRLGAYHLVLLSDDKHFYPAYLAAPVIRTAVLAAYPQIRHVLAPLFNFINEKSMLKLNADVNLLGMTPAAVARSFLIKKGLINRSTATN